MSLVARPVCPPSPDTNPNNPVPGGLLGTTYLVYVDDSGDETQDLLTALAIPVSVWAETLQTWKEFRRWVAKRFDIPTNTELHALGLGTNSNAGRGKLPALAPGDRNQITKAAFSAHSAHHAVLNDRGIGPADSYLRQHAYSKLLSVDDAPSHIWPGGIDADGFPCFTHKLGIRGYP